MCGVMRDVDPFSVITYQKCWPELLCRTKVTIMQFFLCISFLKQITQRTIGCESFDMLKKHIFSVSISFEIKVIGSMPSVKLASWLPPITTEL